MHKSEKAFVVYIKYVQLGFFTCFFEVYYMVLWKGWKRSVKEWWVSCHLLWNSFLQSTHSTSFISFFLQGLYPLLGAVYTSFSGPWTPFHGPYTVYPFIDLASLSSYTLSASTFWFEVCLNLIRELNHTVSSSNQLNQLVGSCLLK